MHCSPCSRPRGAGALEVAGPSFSDVDEETWSLETALIASGGRRIGASAAIGLEMSNDLDEVGIALEPTFGIAGHWRLGAWVPVMEVGAELEDEGLAIHAAPGIRFHPGIDLELGLSCAVGLTEVARGVTVIVLASTEHELGPERDSPEERGPTTH